VRAPIVRGASETPFVNDRPSIRELAAVALVCALALVLRLRGIGYLLPIMPLSDSAHVVEQLDELRHRHDAPTVQAERNFFYPLLLARTTALLPDPGRTAPVPARSLDEHLRLASEPWRQIRIVSVLLSCLIVPATWLLARRLLAGPWPLFATALVATSLLHTVFSSQEKPHGPLASFVALSVVAALRLRERGDVASFLLFGLAAALAVGTLHSGASVLPLVPAVLAWRERSSPRAPAWWMIASLALVALAVYAFYPLHLGGDAADEGPSPYRGDPSKGIVSVSGHLISLGKFRGGGFAVVLESLWTYDPVLTCATLLGAGVAAVDLARRALAGDPRHRTGRKKEIAIVLSFALPYLVATGMYDYNLERFVLPLLPCFACLAAYGVARVASALSRRVRLPAIVPSAGFALPAIALLPAWHLGTVRAAPDTYALAAQCVAAHARPGSDRIVVVPYLDLPLFHGEEALRENARYPARSNWVHYQMQLDATERAGERYEVLVSPGPIQETNRALETDALGYFRALGARYVVIAIDPTGHVALANARAAARANGELLCRVAPGRDDDPQSAAFLYRYTNHPWTRPFACFLMDARCMGNTLEVYRLR
jgi:hypothetical protein